MTDRRTDGQTDRILLAIPRLHYMQRGKNYCYSNYMVKKFLLKPWGGVNPINSPRYTTVNDCCLALVVVVVVRAEPHGPTSAKRKKVKEHSLYYIMCQLCCIERKRIVVCRLTLSFLNNYATSVGILPEICRCP